MDQLSIPEQQDLIKDVEHTIRLTHDGMSPNEALTKIASERKLSPEMIRRAAEAFNKSKSVHVFKTVGEEERAKPFDLIDPSAVIQNIFQPTQKVASSFALPEGRFDAIDFGFSDSMLEKAATEESGLESGVPERDPTDDELMTIERLSKQARIEHEQFCEGMRNKIHMKIQEHKYAFDQSLKTVVGIAQRMSDRQFEKMARRIVTGYPTTGPGLIAILSHQSRKEIPGNLEKMANHIVFRAKEPYLSIANLYKAAEDMAKGEEEMKMFEQKTAAEPFLGSVAANTIANMLAGMGLSPDEMTHVMGSKKKHRRVEEDLDPAFYNRLKAYDAKRTFMMLSLFDPDLKEYDQKSLMKAYNDSVQAIPEAFDKPAILKNLMVRNLQSSGIKDPFEMKQEQDIAKLLREREVIAENKRHEENRRLEAEKDKDKREPISVGITAKSPGEALITGIGDIGKLIPASEKKDPSLDEKVERDLGMIKKNINRVSLSDAREALTAYHSGKPDARQRAVLRRIRYIN